MSERSPAYRRFQASKDINYERWHDGEGYDLAALDQMTAGERRDVESDLIRNTADWRDIEALAALGTDTARAHIRGHLAKGRNDLRLAAARALENDETAATAREDAVIAALETADLRDGFSRALDMAAEMRSPRVTEALLRCTLRPTPVVAVNAAGLVYFVFGKTNEPFDWKKRPFFLRFGEGAEEQRAAFRDMCAELGVDPAPYLTPRA